MTAITMGHKWYQPGRSFACQAEAAITSKWACVIAGTAAYQVVESTGAVASLGFVQMEGTAAALGDWVEVYYTGQVYALASAAITKGALCSPAAGGKIVTAVDLGLVCCYALETCDADGDVILVRLVNCAQSI